ncbi:hypothetical protein CLOM_g15612 [Closterium sp. NIES-68]|nr:hypothetical protein CLOM_g15612 [Closterium sp. NIES-68]
MVREKKTREYLHGCSAIFDGMLPGFDLKEAEKELATWAPIMQNHHNKEGFYQGLGNTESSSARLGELMMISLLRYDINWQEALELWHAKKRRPAKSVVFTSQERKREGKALLGEAEQDSPVPDYLGDDWAEEEEEEGERDGGRAVAIEDNPFLSDDEAEDVVAVDVPEF